MKWDLIWWIIHTINLGIAAFLFPFLGTENRIAYFVFMGFGVALLAQIWRYMLARQKVALGRDFVKWGVVNALTIFVISLLVGLVQISQPIVQTVITALALLLVGKYVPRGHHATHHRRHNNRRFHRHR